MGKGTRASTIDKILDIYPILNSAWLKTGVGYLLLSDERNEKIISIQKADIKSDIRKGALIYDIDATCGLKGRDIEFADERIVGSIDTPEINPESKKHSQLATACYR